MHDRKTVLIPALFPDPVGDRMLAEDDHVEAVYALSEAERALGYRPASRLDLREVAMAEALRERLPTAHALHCLGVRGHLHVDRELIASAERLEVLFIAAAGTDRIDVDAATEHGVVVVNAPGANAAGVAEHALGLMLSLARRVAETDRHAHRERRIAMTRVLETPPGLSLIAGKTVGLVGCGASGSELAWRCAALGAEVIGFDPRLGRARAGDAPIRRVDSLRELLTRADHVSLHVPLTSDTAGMIGARELALMKPTAFFVNTARGACVDTAALTAALRERSIAGAALDVTDPEPLPDGHELFDLDNVVLTPHIAGYSPETNRAATVAAVGAALAALRGVRPHHIVNPQAWRGDTARV
jgi:D-3-phosphoglycerate dehydrogenase